MSNKKSQMTKEVLMLGVVILFIALTVWSVYGLNQTDFCERLGLNLSIVEDNNLCGEYWAFFNNNTIINEYTYINETHNHNYYSNSTGYSKDEVDKMIKEAREEDELEKLQKELEDLKKEDKEEDEILLLRELLANLTDNDEVNKEDEIKTLDAEEIAKIVKMQLMANEDDGVKSYREVNRTDEDDDKNQLFGISVWWFVLILLGGGGFYAYKTGMFGQLKDQDIPPPEQVNFMAQAFESERQAEIKQKEREVKEREEELKRKIKPKVERTEEEHKADFDSEEIP